MMANRRLLVPIDGSPHSLRALTWVIKRAVRDPQLRVVILNVQAPMPPSLFVSPSMIAEHHASAGKAALAKALRKMHRCRLKSETLIAVGEPGETIAKVARHQRCAEIVIGSRGLGSLKGLVLGSVTTKVIHAARVPVTVVP